MSYFFWVYLDRIHTMYRGILQFKFIHEKNVNSGSYNWTIQFKMEENEGVVFNWIVQLYEPELTFFSWMNLNWSIPLYMVIHFTWEINTLDSSVQAQSGLWSAFFSNVKFMLSNTHLSGKTICSITLKWLANQCYHHYKSPILCPDCCVMCTFTLSQTRPPSHWISHP